MATKIDEWGNSLAVRLPRNVLQTAQFRKGTEVTVTAVEKGILISRSPSARPSRRKRKYRLSELLARCKGPNPYKYVGNRVAVGKEIL